MLRLFFVCALVWGFCSSTCATQNLYTRFLANGLGPTPFFLPCIPVFSSYLKQPSKSFDAFLKLYWLRLSYRIHHALELLDTSLGNEPLLCKRLQIRRLMDGKLLQIGADVVELVGVGFLGQGDAVVKRLEAFLDVFRRVLEVEHEGILLARRGAVQAGARRVDSGAFINGGLATMASNWGFFAGLSSRRRSQSLGRVSPW